MTQYTDKVAEQKELLAAEAWGKKVKYIHASNGVLEVKYNSGESHFEETKTGKKWVEGVDTSKESLITKFNRFMQDVQVGRDPNGVG
tara:strand:- start:449 stop:709 length:261 start_codon:yes stop_codon:yes gene_type:complete